MAVTDEQRASQAREAAKELAKLARSASTMEEWAEVANLAGQVQRRSRLLAGMTKGG